jgi:hypothetical protein
VGHHTYCFRFREKFIRHLAPRYIHSFDSTFRRGASLVGVYRFLVVAVFVVKWSVAILPTKLLQNAQTMICRVLAVTNPGLIVIVEIQDSTYDICYRCAASAGQVVGIKRSK